EDAGDERQGQDDDADRSQHTQDVIQPVGEDRLVRALEPDDDLEEVFEDVPDPLGRIGQIVEVDVEVLGQIALLGPLERTKDGALRADDRTEVDDLLLGVADVAHDLGGTAALEYVVLEAPQLAA